MFTCQDMGNQRPDMMLLERLIVSDDLIRVPHELVAPCKRKEWDAEEHAPCTIAQSPQHDTRSCHKEGQGQGMSDREAHGSQLIRGGWCTCNQHQQQLPMLIWLRMQTVQDLPLSELSTAQFHSSVPTMLGLSCLLQTPNGCKQAACP